MKLNKKGITLIEIIISIALISIVLIFLFSLFINVKDMNESSKINSTYLINKSLILKDIENDLSNETVQDITIGTCSISDIYHKYGDSDYFDSINNVYKAHECIMIDGIDSNPAYIALYYYKNKDSYVISYIHGDIKSTRTLPKFEDYNVTNLGKLKNTIILVNSENNSCQYNESNNNFDSSVGCNNSNANFYKISIPIIGSDGKDYTILISYYGKVTVE